MKIVSLVLKVMPEHAAEVTAAVATVAGASVQLDSGDGRLVVLIEDGAGDGNYSTADSIIQVHQLPHVMSVTLAYEYADDGDFPAAAAAAKTQSQAFLEAQS